MSSLRRVHIRLTEQQINFVRKKYGNISMWVRSIIDREIGADEILGRTEQHTRNGTPAEQKRKDQQKVLVWKI